MWFRLEIQGVPVTLTDNLGSNKRRVYPPFLFIIDFFNTPYLHRDIKAFLALSPALRHKAVASV